LQTGTPTGKEDSGPGAGGKTDDNNSWRTPIAKKKRDKNKATSQDAEDEGGQHNKKPRSDDEDSAGGQSKGTEQAGHTVDLKPMSTSLRKKSPKTKILKSKKSKEKQEDSAKKPTNQTPRKKATFAPDASEESGKKKEEGEVAVHFQCVIVFAIRVDKGNNTKGGFNKKLAEGLTFLREFVDPAAFILPNGKDKRLGLIKLKSDLPKYQLTLKNYFNIPNQMAFSNVNQDNGRVIKGSAIMGFSIDPKNCLDDAAGDIRTMGCSLFYKKCQQVDTVSKLILLCVPNSIEEDVIKDTLDKVLSELECTLLQTDSEYKLTKDQRQNWIKYALLRSSHRGCLGRTQRKRKRSRGAITRRWHMYCRSINLTAIDSATYVIWRNNTSYGPIIGEIRPSQSKYQSSIANKAKKSVIYRWFRPMGPYS